MYNDIVVAEANPWLRVSENALPIELPEDLRPGDQKRGSDLRGLRRVSLNCASDPHSTDKY